MERYIKAESIASQIDMINILFLIVLNSLSEAKESNGDRNYLGPHIYRLFMNFNSEKPTSDFGKLIWN